jgi:CHASE2 domain-containing sensor protein
MSIQVFLSFGAGNVSAGFDLINYRLEIDGRLVAQKQGSLPSNPELQNLHYQWQFCYAAYYENCVNMLRGDSGAIELENTGVTGFSVTSFEETTIELARSMRDWLAGESFSEIGADLQHRCKQDTLVIIIESADEYIYRLPWHCWSALADFPQAEITFSLTTYQHQLSTSTRIRPRILAVFGTSIGIDTAADAESIQQLQADVAISIEPSIEQLRQQLEDRQGWDILFFAGHGGESHLGEIQLNRLESVTLTDLSQVFKVAIGRGLKLAIFNCCHGLGLATTLAALDIPTAIVMREAIPNRVAQDFLQTFLHSFESGNSLLAAVAAARCRLQLLEANFPCATWLPVVFWNPTVPLSTWKSFYPQPIVKMKLWRLATIVLATAAAIWGMRSQGYLESAELAAYDLGMNTRPILEPPDDRILIIGVDRTQPLSDRVLVRVLTKIRQYQPQAIGLDIYRDLPFGEGHRDLSVLLKQSSIVSSCLMSDNSNKFAGAAAPEGVKPERVGFTNFSLDRDGIVRRQILGMAPVESPPDRLHPHGCRTDHSLSLRLALKYLHLTEANEAENGNIKIGDREIDVLNSSFGAYRSTHAQENLRGFQLMLNYRNHPQAIPELSLDDLLNADAASHNQHRQAIAGKIVLIGYTGASNDDTVRSVAQANGNRLHGVKIHAQMTSNIISHLLDRRALITTWSDLAEFGWILLWGTVGGAIWWRFSGYKFWLAEIGVIVVVVITYGVYLDVRSVWIPLVPAELAAILTPAIAMGTHRWQLKSQPPQ